MEYGPRVRTSDVARNTPAGWKRYIDNALYDEATETDFDWFTESNRMEDVVIENFRTRSMQGEVFNNPCSITNERVTYENLTWAYGLKAGYTPYRLSLWGNPGYLSLIPDLPGHEDFTNEVNLAVTKARSRVTSEVMMLGATLGELRETREMFKLAAFRLRNFGQLANAYLDKLSSSKGASKKLGVLSNTLSDLWMECRFGWRPFAGEAQNFYSALQGLSKFAERQTFRAGNNLTYTNNDVTSWYQDPTITWNFARSVSEEISIRAGVLAEQRYGGVPDTWGLTKIPQTLWELTRLSWAVDYFLNVGDLIAAYVPDSLWTPMSAWVTVKRKRLAVVRHTNLTSDYWEITSSPPSRTTLSFSYVRTPDPTPTIAHKLPKFLGDSAKLLDIALLTRQSANSWLKRAYSARKRRK